MIPLSNSSKRDSETQHKQVFISFSNHDSAYVRQVGAILRKHNLDVFLYEDHEHSAQTTAHRMTGSENDDPPADPMQEISEALQDAHYRLIFLGEHLQTSPFQHREISTIQQLLGDAQNQQLLAGEKKPFTTFLILLYPAAIEELGSRFSQVKDCTRIKAFRESREHGGIYDRIPAKECARRITAKLELPWQGPDDLPYNPHIFSYEKDIIQFFERLKRLGFDLYKPAEKPDYFWMTDEEKSGLTEEKEQELIVKENRRREEDRQRLLDGCPGEWPEVIKLKEQHYGTVDIRYYENSAADAKLNVQHELGQFRPEGRRVGAAALRGYHTHDYSLEFPEAGPRERLCFPTAGRGGHLHVGILVSGGIAPGINAVIDGIVQRHYRYAKLQGREEVLKIYGYRNGFLGVLNADADLRRCTLRADAAAFGNALATSQHADQGGAIIGTSRLDTLLDGKERLDLLGEIEENLRDIDILYMIGGDGTMRAAHALWSIAAERLNNRNEQNRRRRPLSVVAIPKTMDNDILWVWQSFGFLSAVDKAREVIEALHTEVSSNPRVCVLQLFGSDSGFVVSHGVLASAAGHCDVALIPEVSFSLLGLADYLKTAVAKKKQPIPGGLIVMAETAIPVDAAYYLDPEHFPVPSQLSDRMSEITAIRNALNAVSDETAQGERHCRNQLLKEEKQRILDFAKARRDGLRLQGQTDDCLRRAGLKMVMLGIDAILRNWGSHSSADGADRDDVDWEKLRMLANEPRHLVRAIAPSTSDIVIAQRLGSLAVDNAMAGYTDFMISQWLTEYVLVPLKLVALGRKRIPESGVFWKSVLAKTGQHPDLVRPWPLDPLGNPLDDPPEHPNA